MSSIYLLLFMLKVTLATDLKAFNVDTLVTDYGHIAEFILGLEKNLQFKPIFLLICDKKTESDDINDNDIVSKLFNQGVPLISTDRPETLYTVFPYNVVGIIYLINCENLSHFFDAHGFQDNWKYLIIIPKMSPACKTYMEVLGNYTLVDLSIVISEDKLNQTLWSFLPVFNETDCDVEPTSQAVLINYFTKGSWKQKEIFPQKTPRDYKKCPLNVGVADMFPYSEVGYDFADMTPITNAVGSDIELVKIFSEFHNLTPKFWHVYKHTEDPRMSTRFLTYLTNSSLDVCVGGFYRLYGDQVEYSGIYNRQVIRWVYPIIREERHWTKFVKKLTTSYIFFLFYLCYSLVWTYASRIEDQPASLQASFTSAWGALMSSSGLLEARTNKQRILNFFYLYMCIHFSAFLGAKLYSFLTIQAPGPLLQSNEDVMSSGKMPYLSNASRNFLDDAKFIAFVTDAIDCAREKCSFEILKHNGVTLVLSSFLPPIQVETSINYEAKLVATRDNVLTVYHEMLLRKDSFFVDAFKDTMLRLVESGVTDWLYSTAIGVTQVGMAETATKNALVNSYSCQEGCAITLSQIGGIFYVWAVGCWLATIVFLVELVYFKRSFCRSEI